MKNLRLGASLVAVLVALLPAATPVGAASCNGASHQSTLSRGTVKPGTVNAGQAITFSVVYADTAGCAPKKVSVTVAGAGAFPLRGTGTNYTSGVTFSASVTLPAGTRAYTFSATSGSGNGTRTVTLTAVAPTSVVVLTPTPTVAPTPIATAAPVAPATKPPSPPTVVAPAPQPPAPPSIAAPTGSGTTATAGAASVTAMASATPAAEPAAAGPMHDSWIGAPAAVAHVNDGAARPPRQEAVGTFLAAELPLTIGTFVTATAGGLGLFFLVLRRRRSDPRAAAATATASASDPSPGRDDTRTPPSGVATVGAMKLNLPPIRELVPPLDPYLLADPDERIGPSPDEAGIPRWLRPSVRAARMGTMELRQRNWKA